MQSSVYTLAGMHSAACDDSFQPRATIHFQAKIECAASGLTMQVAALARRVLEREVEHQHEVC